jgi:hypothetical protein
MTAEVERDSPDMLNAWKVDIECAHKISIGKSEGTGPPEDDEDGYAGVNWIHLA